MDFKLGTHWCVKWILTEDFKFWIKSNTILTGEVVQILRYENKLLLMTNIIKHSHKQPSEVFFKNICSQKFRNIHRKTPVLENTFSPERYEKEAPMQVFLCEYGKILRTPILMNISERLLLHSEK